ncbi:endonuclease III [Rheinheimera pacifica]|nr:endonuclease III [Rheinheimera pacifica]
MPLSCLSETAEYVAISYRTAIFSWPTIAADTHIFRVSNRPKLAPGKNVDEVEHKLLKVVPDEFKLDVHHWLILTFQRH